MGTRSGDYFADIHDPRKRYLAMLQQQAKEAISIDINDAMESLLDATRRPLQSAFNNQFVGDSFKIIGAGRANDFDLDGDGAVFTDADSWARGWVAGLPALLSEDPRPMVPTAFPTTAQQKDELYHRSTALTSTVLTDTSAQFVTGELVGRTLFPNADSSTGFAITANTATTITTAGDHTSVAAVGDFYRIGLTTPGSNREDGVYLDVYLDEIDATEDSDLLHPIGPGVESARRLMSTPRVFVREDVPTHGELVDYTDADGNKHYVTKLAKLDRLTSDPNVSSGMVTDLRDPNFGSGPEVVAARGTAVDLDARLDVALNEDGTLKPEPFDTHRDEMHSNGLFAGATAVQPSLPPLKDKVDLVQLLAGEKLFVDGKEITTLTATDITFVGVTARSLFSLLVDNTGAPTKSLRLEYTAANISNVFIVGVSEGTGAATGKQLMFTVSGSTLAWDGGPALAVADDDGIVRLYDSGGVDFVDVFVGSPLPGSDNTDTVDISALHDTDANFLIGTAVHDGVAAIIDNTLIDRRQFGTTGSDVLRDDALEDNKILRLEALAAHGDGVVHGFAVTGVGTSTFNIAGGRAIVDGKIRSAITGTKPTTGANVTNYVRVDADGSFQVTTTDPRVQTFPPKNRFALLAIATIDGVGNISTLTDARVVPFKLLEVLAPLVDGTLSGDPTFSGAVGLDGVTTVGSSGELTFTAGAQFTNIPDDSIAGPDIQDGAITEPKVESVYRKSLRRPVRRHAMPPGLTAVLGTTGTIGGLLYEPFISAPGNPPAVTVVRVHSFPLSFYDESVDDFVWSPGISGATDAPADESVFEDIDTATDSALYKGTSKGGSPGDIWDDSPAPANVNTWYHMYAELQTDNTWRPKLAEDIASNRPDGWGYHPSSLDHRWLGYLRSRPGNTQMMPLWKFADGWVKWDPTFGETGIIGPLNFNGNFDTGWVSEDFGTSPFLVPTGVRRVLLQFSVRIPFSGQTLVAFAADGTWSGTGIGTMASFGYTNANVNGVGVEDEVEIVIGGNRKVQRRFAVSGHIPPNDDLSSFVVTISGWWEPGII